MRLRKSHSPYQSCICDFTQFLKLTRPCAGRETLLILVPDNDDFALSILFYLLSRENVHRCIKDGDCSKERYY